MKFRMGPRLRKSRIPQILLVILIFLISIGFFLFNSFTFYSVGSTGSSTLPAYATVGAYANYTGSGGFIAFFSGVTGNLSDTVTNVPPNGSMDLFVNGNLSLGTEVDVPTSQISEHLTDSISSPKFFPAIPTQDLLSRQIVFQNISCLFETSTLLTVPAGSFAAVEYQGTGVNDSTLDFWFDNSTGLALQMSGSGAELQLIGSNIARPLSIQSPSAFDLPIIAVFLVGWTVAGLLFYSVRRHYINKSKVDGYLPRKEEDIGKVNKNKSKKGKLESES